jgi:adenosylcobinamide-phosphate synthase
MSFFAVLLALVIEQLRPLPSQNAVHEAMVAWTRWIGRNFDAGRDHHAWVVWGISVLLPAVAVAGVHLLLAPVSLLLSLAWSVLVLYLTLGFRQFSHHYTGIRDALARGDETEARRLLAEWRHLDASELPRAELLRQVIEHSLVAAHRHVFGVFFWFVLLAALGLGPAGAVLYRLAEFSSRYWAFRSRTVGVPINERLMQRSQALFAWIDHAPARLTAFGFAVVGDFEAAIECWRRDARLWHNANDGILLAAAAGAVGVRLGGGAVPPVTPDLSKGLSTGGSGEAAAWPGGSTPGLAPEFGHLRSVVGLVWRSVVLWMLLLALLTLANLIG